jgi:WD40 repeat protein
MDVSKCNQFLASAGKDAQIIIWELATGRMVQKLQSHTSMINRIQFFSPRQNTKDAKSTDPLQFLLSCSDDGTVRLYDFTPICVRPDSQVSKS